MDLVYSTGSVLVSEASIAELTEVLKRPHLRRYLSAVDAKRSLASLAGMAEWVEVTTSLRFCRDAKDDKFLGLAVDGSASHIVTGDLDLLALNPFREVRILPPHSFLDAET